MHFTWTGVAKIDLVHSIFPEPGVTNFGLTSGTLTVAATGVDLDGCTINGSLTVALSPGVDTVSLALMAQPPTYQFTIETPGEDINPQVHWLRRPPANLPYPISGLQYANTPSSVALDPSATTLERNVNPPAQPSDPVEHEHRQITL